MTVLGVSIICKYSMLLIDTMQLCSTKLYNIVGHYVIY